MSSAYWEGPHSRACGIVMHDHGTACHNNCPTCKGRPINFITESTPILPPLLHKFPTLDLAEPGPGPDPINPPHYQGDAVMVFIEKFGLGFTVGNCVKYLSRAGKKDSATRLQDLKKAQWYLEREIMLEEGQV